MPGAKHWCAGLMLLPASALAEWSGNLAVQGAVYPQTALDSRQADQFVSLSAQPKYSWERDRDHVLVFEPFVRLDSADSERSHADIRELTWLSVDGDLEWRIGIDHVFWGVTESQHLVDIVNQTDTVESFSGDDKLGQPMLHLTWLQDWGVLDAFVLTGFRERTFPGSEGRLRTQPRVDSEQTQYQSAAGRQHVDYALRYKQYLGDWEVGLSAFSGTSREPRFLLGSDAQSLPVLVPIYDQIRQLGIDLQGLVGEWTWKLEAIRRSTPSGYYSASTAGFEYTFYALNDSAIDLGTLLEYSYDSRGDLGAVLNRDVFAGLRFTFNDVQSTDVLAGVLQDTDNQARSFRLEANRRLGDSYKLTLELQSWSSDAANEPLTAFRHDDFIRANLAWYF